MLKLNRQLFINFQVLRVYLKISHLVFYVNLEIKWQAGYTMSWQFHFYVSTQNYICSPKNMYENI